MTCDERFLFRDGDCGAGTMGRGDPLGSADNRPGSPHGMTAVLHAATESFVPRPLLAAWRAIPSKQQLPQST